MIHATIWLSVNSGVDKKKKSEKAMYSMIPFIKHSQMAEF